MASHEYSVLSHWLARLSQRLIGFMRSLSSSQAVQRLARPLELGLLFVAATTLIAAALTRSANHDESQYVAAIALARGGLPYRDFAYLQAPLQPLLLVPLGYLPAGWMLLGTRLTNSLFGLLSLLLLLIAARGRTSPSAALSACAALLFTDAFLLASSLARNDALAMVLISASLPCLLSALEKSSSWLFVLGGVALGLATCAKINAALPAAAAGLFLLMRVRRLGVSPVFGFASGITLGLLPAVVLALSAPDAFAFDVIAYNLHAPTQWWTSIGSAAELGLFRRAVKLLGFASLGSVLVGLIAAALDEGHSDSRRLLDYMIGGGILAAILPQPALVQYVVPLLPPLFVRLALAFDGVGPLMRRALLLLMLIGSVAGATSGLLVRFSGDDILRRAAAGETVAALTHGAQVSTLSPQFIAGRGVLLDPRFAAGPFLYRTRGALARSAEVEGRAVTVERIEGSFELQPPAALMVGGETNPFRPDYPQGLDRPLLTWALAHHYRPTRIPGGFVLLMRSR